jgi:putative transposase
MSLLSKGKIKQMIKDNNFQSTEDIQSTLKKLFGVTLQEMPEAELEDLLDYVKHDTKNKETK